MRSLVVSVAVIVVLLGCADAALRVENARADGAITIVNLPGCCNYCVAEICPAVCEPCRSVVVEEGETVTLEDRVGPYPLERLQVQVKTGDVYCVARENDLQHLTETALFQVGPGSNCDREQPSINARIVIEDDTRPPDSGRFEICLLKCDNTLSVQ